MNAPSHPADHQQPRKAIACLLIASTLLLSWLWMQIVHEAGHVLAAWSGGGKVGKVVLHPLAFSRTDLLANPDPLLGAWGGIIGGVLLPAGLWAAMRLAWKNASFITRFFLGFCLVANGLYLVGGLAGRVGDVGDLIRLGQPAWVLGTVGMLLAAGGLACWHKLGPSFGLGPGRTNARPAAAVAVWALLLATIAAEIMFSEPA